MNLTYSDRQLLLRFALQHSCLHILDACRIKVLSQNVCRRADLDFVQKECPSHANLLERLLQLWTLHCLSRTYNFGPAVSNKLNAQSDHLGVFRPAVLPVDRQLHRRRFQEDVRKQFASTHRFYRNCMNNPVS